MKQRSCALVSPSLEQQVAHLTKQLFARKSERLADDKHPKLPLVWDEPEPPPPPHVEEAPDEEFEEITYKRKMRGATRISKDLPRETTTIALPEAERRCPCCNELMCKIGEEVSERLDYTPAVLKVIETRREKYACEKHEESGVLTPPVPIHPIEKGMATSGLLAHVLVAKYKDHLPLYRQSSIFARHGAEIAESTLCDWVKDATELLQPVVLAMKTSVLASHVVQSDDTGTRSSTRTPLTAVAIASCGRTSAIATRSSSTSPWVAVAMARRCSSATFEVTCKSTPMPATTPCCGRTASRQSAAGPMRDVAYSRHSEPTRTRRTRWK